MHVCVYTNVHVYSIHEMHSQVSCFNICCRAGGLTVVLNSSDMPYDAMLAASEIDLCASAGGEAAEEWLKNWVEVPNWAAEYLRTLGGSSAS